MSLIAERNEAKKALQALKDDVAAKNEKIEELKAVTGVKAFGAKQATYKGIKER
jgi:hypothetical protein